VEKKTWSELCLDPRWQKLRLEVFERDEWACIRCQSKDRTLHAHHLFYDTIERDGFDEERRRYPWEYDLGDLVTFCADCHAEERERFPEYGQRLLQLFGMSGWTSDGIAMLVEFLERARGTISPDRFLDALEPLRDPTEEEIQEWRRGREAAHVAND
jgi:hypothetical protein